MKAARHYRRKIISKSGDKNPLRVGLLVTISRWYDDRKQYGHIVAVWKRDINGRDEIYCAVEGKFGLSEALHSSQIRVVRRNYGRVQNKSVQRRRLVVRRVCKR